MTVSTAAKAAPTKKKAAPAAKKKGTAVSTTTEETTTSPFEVTDEAPSFLRTQGRAKSELRKAIEDLGVGKYLRTGKNGSDKNAISSISQMKRAIEKDNEGVKLSVRQDENKDIWVYRKS